MNCYLGKTNRFKRRENDHGASKDIYLTVEFNLEYSSLNSFIEFLAIRMMHKSNMNGNANSGTNLFADCLNAEEHQLVALYYLKKAYHQFIKLSDELVIFDIEKDLDSDIETASQSTYGSFENSISTISSTLFNLNEITKVKDLKEGMTVNIFGTITYKSDKRRHRLKNDIYNLDRKTCVVSRW